MDYVNTAYHCRAALWPVGYRAVRVVLTPAGGKAPGPHTLEILEGRGHAGGTGPVFRITPPPKGPRRGEPVEGDTFVQVREAPFASHRWHVPQRGGAEETQPRRPPNWEANAAGGTQPRPTVRSTGGLLFPGGL